MSITIRELLSKAKEMGASDLHLTVGIPPKCRVNGELKNMDYDCLKQEDTNAVISAMLSERRLKILKSYGEVDFACSISEIGRLRVNAFKQKGLLACVIRLVGSDIPTPEDLKLPSPVIELTKKKRGLILVTGPTGSGKSTTLASLIDRINEENHWHIITLEDPIEYLYSHKKSMVNQREIGLDTRSYDSALRAALREDPDVILVGELEDPETIETAIMAAETGHLVFSTLPTVGAAASVNRMIDVFLPHKQQQIRIQLASVLEAVISQQLIPSADGSTRIAAFEIMQALPGIKSLIREGKEAQIPSFMQSRRNVGMQLMDDAIFSLYSDRRIDASQAVSFAQDAPAMERKLFV